MLSRDVRKRYVMVRSHWHVVENGARRGDAKIIIGDMLGIQYLSLVGPYFREESFTNHNHGGNDTSLAVTVNKT